jgi:hypothetical protein
MSRRLNSGCGGGGGYAVFITYFPAFVTSDHYSRLSQLRPVCVVGTLIWASTFISLGYMLGEEWSRWPAAGLVDTPLR